MYQIHSNIFTRFMLSYTHTYTHTHTTIYAIDSKKKWKNACVTFVRGYVNAYHYYANA